MKTLLSVASAFVFAIPAAASTYVVDDSGGAGVDFTDLPAAIAAAVKGDVLIVRAGNYSGFVLDKALTIVCDSGVRAAFAQVTNVTSDTAIVASLHCDAVGVTDCFGTVIFDQLDGDALTSNSAPPLSVSNCRDVRVQRSVFFPASALPGSATSGPPGAVAVSIDASRVEFSSCLIIGGTIQRKNLGCPSFFTGGRGGNAIEASNGSFVHLALSNVYGGEGQGVMNLCNDNSITGNGGNALVLGGGSSALIAGTSPNEIVAGAAGENVLYGDEGNPGRAIVCDATSVLRRSGVAISGGTTAPAGAVTIAVPDDPTLELTGTAVPNGPVTFTLHGPIGSNGRLLQGSAPLLVADGLAFVEQLCNRIRIHPLGPNTTGQLDTTFVTPSTWPTGRTRIFQGFAIDTATNTLIERTNSVTVVVH